MSDARYTKGELECIPGNQYRAQTHDTDFQFFFVFVGNNTSGP